MSLQNGVSAYPRFWKTRVSGDASNRKMYVNSRLEPNLSGQVKLFPTAQDAKNSTEDGIVSETEMKDMSQGSNGQLNPDWVEWLMGFPIGWTDIGT